MPANMPTNVTDSVPANMPTNITNNMPHICPKIAHKYDCKYADKCNPKYAHKYGMIEQVASNKSS